MTTPATVDPWLDTEFGSVDFHQYREDKELEPDTSTEMIQPDFGQVTTPAEVITNVPAEPVVETAPVAAAEPVEPEGPEVIELDGGGTVTIEKTKSKGWKASIDVGIGGVQNFYGNTKNELLLAAFKAQANATKKIRDLNKQVKFGTSKESAPATQPVIPTTPRALSADEVFAIKTKLESNPDLALEEWFQAKTGLSVHQLVTLAQKGQQASQELEAEAVNKTFLSTHRDTYYPDPEYKNFASIISLIAKQRLDKTVTPNNQEAVFNRLVAEGHYTVQNLDEAFEELTEAGLLISAPRRPEAVVTPAAPAPLPADPRIVSRVVQPRAGLGLRQTETTSVPVTAPKPPSADDLNNLSDQEIKDLMHQTLRLARTQGRRS